MQDKNLFIVGGGLAVLGGAWLGFLTIATWGICMFSPGGTVIRILLLDLTAWGFLDTRVLLYSCCCPSPDSRCGDPSTVLKLFWGP